HLLHATTKSGGARSRRGTAAALAAVGSAKAACSSLSRCYLPAMSKARYIEAKQKWAEKQKARGVTARALASRDRLPPGQKLTDGFPVLDLGVQPEILLRDWRLKLDGLVATPLELTWEQFHALPQ